LPGCRGTEGCDLFGLVEDAIYELLAARREALARHTVDGVDRVAHKRVDQDLAAVARLYILRHGLKSSLSRLREEKGRR